MFNFRSQGKLSFSGVKGVKELSLPAVAEELRQMPLEGNLLMFDFKQ